MTQRTDARLAGIAYLVYIVLTMTSVTVFGRVMAAGGVMQQLADLARMMPQARVTIVLDLLQVPCALVLAVTLYRLTKEVNPTLAILAMMFRVGEGLLGAASIRGKLELMWLARNLRDHASANGLDAASLGAYFLHEPDSHFAEFCFVIGGFLFAYLLLRGRLIPSILAWIGVVTQGIQTVLVPLNIAGFIGGSAVDLFWLLILAYEIPVGIWLIVKGVRPYATMESPSQQPA